jgi:hypothetical protein
LKARDIEEEGKFLLNLPCEEDEMEELEKEGEDEKDEEKESRKRKDDGRE